MTTHACSTLDRRQFLRKSALLSASSVAAPSILSAQFLGPSPSNRINIGVVGLGGRGMALMQSFLRQKDVQVTALCDVDLEHYRSNTWGKGRVYGLNAARHAVEQYYGEHQKKNGLHLGSHVYHDFRVLCAREDVDAVVVATPDHWHYHQVMESLKNGKDVYCEKPVTHSFMEGKMIYREVLRRKAIFQTGSQQRSTGNFHRAVELVRNGHIGKIKRVEVGLPAGYKEPKIPAIVEPIPNHLDYDSWSGPAPLLPYMRARHHQLWRGHLAYGGGNIMDWIGHHNDIAHWGVGMDQSGPLEVEAIGWTQPEAQVYDAPIEFEIRCLYPGNIEWLIASKFQMGTKWIGENGWIYVNRGKLEASDPRWIAKDFNPGPAKVYQSTDHIRNFIDGVKQRKQCIAPAETGHRSITPGHLGYASHKLGRKLRFDAKVERVLDDSEANALLNKTYRRPWKI